MQMQAKQNMPLAVLWQRINERSKRAARAAEQERKKEESGRAGEQRACHDDNASRQAGKRSMRVKGRARGARAGSIAPLGSAIILPVPVCCPGGALWSKVCEIPCKYELNNIGTENAA